MRMKSVFCASVSVKLELLMGQSSCKNNNGHWSACEYMCWFFEASPVVQTQTDYHRLIMATPRVVDVASAKNLNSCEHTIDR